MKKFRTTHKKLLSLLLAVMMLLSIAPANLFSVTASGYAPRKDAPSYSGYYAPRSSYNPFTVNYNAYGGNCTWYAWGRAYELLGSRPNLSTGDAGKWFGYNQTNGYYSYGSTPKLGAIACWSGHVAVVEEIYSNGSFLISESGWSTCYFRTVTIQSNGTYNGAGTFQGFIYIGDFPNYPPVNAQIKTDKINYGKGETVNFDFITDGTVNDLWVYYPDGSSKPYSNVGNSYQLAFQQEGQYQALVQTWNDLGNKISEKIYFRVYDTPTVEISSDKDIYAIDESIEIKMSGINNGYYTLGIWLDSERVATQDGADSDFVFRATKPGIYMAYCTSYGAGKIVDSEKIYFRVYDTPTAEISSDKDMYVVGEQIKITMSGINNGYYTLGIWLDSERVATQDGADSDFVFQANKPGVYMAYCTSYGAEKIADSEKIYFTVYDPNQTFNIMYNPNGGKNAPSSQTKKYCESITLSSTVPTRDGYNFLGWSTDSNATVPEYLPGDTYSENKELTLYAVWEEVKETKDIMGTIKTFGDPTDEVYVDFYKPGESESCGYTIFRGDAEEFCIGGIQQGEYIIKISKPNHVTREYSVVVDKDIELDIQLNLIGDVDGNGKVNITDYNAILRHVKKTGSIDGYSFDCADIDGNGKILVTDYNAVLRHVKKTELLW